MKTSLWMFRSFYYSLFQYSECKRTSDYISLSDNIPRCLYGESPFDPLRKNKISNPDSTGNQRSHEINSWPHVNRIANCKNDLGEIAIKTNEYEIGS